MAKDIKDLETKLLAFRDARDWAQFHSPRNLALALSVEAGELLEHFLWCSDEQSESLPSQADKKAKIEEEVADVFMYTVLLAESMNIDLMAAAHKKIALNEQRYPADRVRGSARKHSEYPNLDSKNAKDA